VRPRLGITIVSAVLLVHGCAVRTPWTPDDRLDVNSAPRARLEELPGIRREDAERIVAGRPYASKEDVLARKILTREQYDQVAGRLYVGPPGTPDYLREVPPTPVGP
jgi:DNA uptake protein ComE-like DNA-binding protein